MTTVQDALARLRNDFKGRMSNLGFYGSDELEGAFDNGKIAAYEAIVEEIDYLLRRMDEGEIG
jgi:hypothetical protein